MAFERKWAAVPPQLFTADGTAFGLITIADTAGFKVKQSAYLSNTANAKLAIQVKRVLSSTQLIVAIIDNAKMSNWLPLNIVAWTVTSGASISAEEQDKNNIPEVDHYKAIYEADPTVADRVVNVDEYGGFYGSANPLPVSITGTFPVTVRRLTDKPNDGTPDDLPDAIQIGDGTNRLSVNPDGSINVVAESSGSVKNLVNTYNEVNSVPSATPTNLVTYMVPIGKTAILERASVSGENIARFDIQINSITLDTKRTFFGRLNEDFNFSSPDVFGTPLIAGDVVLIVVIHNRPDLGSFEGRIQVVEVG